MKIFKFFFQQSKTYHRIPHCKKCFEITKQININSSKRLQNRNGWIRCFLWKLAALAMQFPLSEILSKTDILLLETIARFFAMSI